MSRRRRPLAGQAELDLFALDTPEPEQPSLPPPDDTTRVEIPKPDVEETPPQSEPEPSPAAPASPARAARVSGVRGAPRKIAENVSHAWYSHHGAGGDIAIPIGAVAALCLVRQRDPDGPDLAAQFMALDPGDLVKVLRDIWAHQWIAHPYLIEIARPLHDWLNDEREPDDLTARAVRAVVHAALKSGLLSITGWADPYARSDTDLLGVVLTEMRSKGARDGLGQFFTPGSVADMMARMLIGQDKGLTPGQWFDEPAAGTGGMFRALAQAIRDQGQSTHEFGWSMGELDPVAAACAAVNAIVWDLGPNVLIHVGDSLAVGNGPERAFEHRKAVLAHYEQVQAEAMFEAATRRALALLASITADPVDEEAAEETVEAAPA